MMKFLMFFVMLIPLGLLNKFWLIGWLISLISLFFLTLIPSGFSFIGCLLGLDILSYVLILLTLWVSLLMLVASEKIFSSNNFSGFFTLMVLVLMISLFLTFSSLNLFVFYFFFEVSLIPTVMLIMGWGYQPERLQAGFYLLFYTLLVSLPMMVSIFYCYEKTGMLIFNLLFYFDELLMYVCMSMVFFIKVPMFFLHLWLPKAHVEAPISGSMILAGIMLKLGGYGLLRVLKMFIFVNSKINVLFISVSLMGAFLISLICLRQSDMKMLIAYSSVSHMGIMLAGLLTLNFWGMMGSLAMMVAHGLCSSGLFCLANISYERTHSRSLYLNKGLINLMPNLSMWWFLLLSSSMAAPPSFNLLGEILLINSLVSFSNFNMLLLAFSSFLGGAYSLFLYSFSQHGKYYSGLFSFSVCSIREYLLLFLHWVPLNLMILKGELFSLWV
uniref:NADH-ubiquinone oxidoreductase chain 4 n=1 Tax=Mordellochroa milleri TaxID=1588259 RepID=A0A343C1Q0_9CUCU|nr:NADH dehydrogenase subunit 4 [Mordellochroa milleri]